MQSNIHTICPSAEKSNLGICHLKRYWQRFESIKLGRNSVSEFESEWNLDLNMLAALGLGLEQTLKEIYTSLNTLEEFESWILLTNNQSLSQVRITEFNEYVLNPQSKSTHSFFENVLSAEDLNFWEANGFVVVKNAVSKNDCSDTIGAICNFLDIDLENAASWYKEHPAKQGIMVQMYQHPMIEKNRLSPRIRKAYEQIWQRTDIHVNIDKMGFNPPETNSYKFSASGLHWDVSLKTPIPFGLQGLLYLSDTKAEQGAFTVVPGFHNKIEKWLHNLPINSNPRNEDLYQLGPIPIAANAGDFIIWHHCIPHCASPNNTSTPRFVQYMSYAPLDAAVATEWI